MKKIRFILLIIIAGLAGYLLGNYHNSSKHYEVACLEADFIHFWMDDEDLGPEIEESYYEWFQDLDIGVYNTKYVRSIDEMKKYSWCY